jgi:uncharacterized protein (DUF952 family)
MKQKFLIFLIGILLNACSTTFKENKHMENRFFKILTPIQWQCFEKERVFLGSELDQQDGFIHLSFHHQWKQIWQKFFNGDECYLLEIDGGTLRPDFLKIEANRPGGEEYPHYYGNILLSSVTAHQLIKK